jgi:DNA-binding beta-propeller fold protein YncE
VGRSIAGLFSVAVLVGSHPDVAARIPTGLAPAGAVAAFGSVWVANDRAGTLARVDPRTNRVRKRIRLRPGAFSVAAGFGALWVVNYHRNAVSRIDPRSGRVRSVRVGAVPFDVLPAFGHVWVTAWQAGMLVELAPRPLRIVRRIAVGHRPTGLTLAGGALWVGFGRDATAIARVDPESGTIERVPVGVRSPSWFVAGARDLWIQADDNVLVHVDPDLRRAVDRLSFGRTLAQGAVGPDGLIWIPDKEQSVVFRVDPVKGRVVDSVQAGPGAFFALRAFRSMWVTSYAGRDIWRFRLGAS